MVPIETSSQTGDLADRWSVKWASLCTCWFTVKPCRCSGGSEQVSQGTRENCQVSNVPFLTQRTDPHTQQVWADLCQITSRKLSCSEKGTSLRSQTEKCKQELMLERRYSYYLGSEPVDGTTSLCLSNESNNFFFLVFILKKFSFSLYKILIQMVNLDKYIKDIWILWVEDGLITFSSKCLLNSLWLISLTRVHERS